MKKSLCVDRRLSTMLLSACAPAAPADRSPGRCRHPPRRRRPPRPLPGHRPAKAANPGLQMDSAKVAAQFFTDAAYDQSQDLMDKHGAESGCARSTCST